MNLGALPRQPGWDRNVSVLRHIASPSPHGSPLELRQYRFRTGRPSISPNGQNGFGMSGMINRKRGDSPPMRSRRSSTNWLPPVGRGLPQTSLWAERGRSLPTALTSCSAQVCRVRPVSTSLLNRTLPRTRVSMARPGTPGPDAHQSFTAVDGLARLAGSSACFSFRWLASQQR